MIKAFNEENSDRVSHVLLSDGWHEVWSESWRIEPGLAPSGEELGLWFEFLVDTDDPDDVRVILGPLSAVIALLRDGVTE